MSKPSRAEIEAILAGLGNDTFAGITRTVDLTVPFARALCTALLERMDRVEELEGRHESGEVFGESEEDRRKRLGIDDAYDKGWADARDERARKSLGGSNGGR